jgi:hypothetical protein
LHLLIIREIYDAMEMPNEVTNMLVQNRDGIWAATVTLVFGACGSYVAVLMSALDGKPMSPKEVWATLFIGTVVAFGFSSVIGSLIGVPFEKTLPIAGTALMTGMLGRRIAKLILKLPVSLGGKEGAI